MKKKVEIWLTLSVQTLCCLPLCWLVSTDPSSFKYGLWNNLHTTGKASVLSLETCVCVWVPFFLTAGFISTAKHQSQLVTVKGKSWVPLGRVSEIYTNIYHLNMDYIMVVYRAIGGNIGGTTAIRYPPTAIRYPPKGTRNFPLIILWYLYRSPAKLTFNARWLKGKQGRQGM